MANQFQMCLPHILQEEGGYANHPKDPGGATMNGVTQRVYDDYRSRKKKPRKPVREILPSERDEIYRNSYWKPIRGDELPLALALVVFDGAVNSGVGQSVKWLQRALGVRADGVLGPTTLDAAKNCMVPFVVSGILSRRLAFLKELDGWPTFGKGWAARLARVRKTAEVFMAKDITPSKPTNLIPNTHASNPAAPKAPVTDAKAAPSTAFGDVSVGAGAVSAALAQAQEQLAPFTNIEFIAKFAAAITVASIAVMAIGLAYRFYAARRAAKRAEALDLVPA